MTGERYTIDRARTEVLRCQRNIDRGGEPDFWIRRLTSAAKVLEAAATILRMQIAALESKAGPGARFMRRRAR